MAQIGPRDDPASRPRRFLLPPGGAALNEGKRMGWSRKLSPPLVLRDGRVLQALSDAREMILGLPEGQQRAAYWLHAGELLLYAAENDRAAVDDARMQLSRALHRDGLI